MQNTNTKDTMLRVFVSIALIFTTFLSFAQTPNRPTLPYALNGPVDSQFYYINALSRSQDASFKIIRRTNLDILKNNTLDTINKLKTEITELREASSSHVGTTTALRDSISTLETELQTERQRTNSISFLGIEFSKSGYHTLVWSLIIGLAVAFIATFFAFRKSKTDTLEHKNTAEELQEELQAFKKKALEKEQILKRQLLDEQLKRNS